MFIRRQTLRVGPGAGRARGDGRDGGFERGWGRACTAEGRASPGASRHPPQVTLAGFQSPPAAASARYIEKEIHLLRGVVLFGWGPGGYGLSMQHLAPAGARRERPTRASRPPPGHILPSKLVPPGLPRRYVERPRLWELLDGARQRPLTLVAASAGAGKTVMLSGWAGRLAPTACGWVSLDADDNDPVRFWTYVAAALEGLVPEVGVEAADLLSESRDGMDDRAVSSLANDLAAAGTAFRCLPRARRRARPHPPGAAAGAGAADRDRTRLAPPGARDTRRPWLRLHRLRAQGTLPRAAPGGSRLLRATKCTRC